MLHNLELFHFISTGTKHNKSRQLCMATTSISTSNRNQTTLEHDSHTEALLPFSHVGLEAIRALCNSSKYCPNVMHGTAYSPSKTLRSVL